MNQALFLILPYKLINLHSLIEIQLLVLGLAIELFEQLVSLLKPLLLRRDQHVVQVLRALLDHILVVQELVHVIQLGQEALRHRMPLSGLRLRTVLDFIIVPLLLFLPQGPAFTVAVKFVENLKNPVVLSLVGPNAPIGVLDDDLYHL